jgi:hypothetical protein
MTTLLDALATFWTALNRVQSSLDDRERASFLAGMASTIVSVERIESDLGRMPSSSPPVVGAEPWDTFVQRLSLEEAERISIEFSNVSQELTEAFRESRAVSDAAIIREPLRDAIGFLYADVLRPLWQVFPDLQPSELREM